MWQEKIETMHREELEALQSERLRNQVKRMYERVELFRNRMDELGLKPEDIRGIEDIHKLPMKYLSDELATKAYVDASVSGAGGEEVATKAYVDEMLGVIENGAY